MFPSILTFDFVLHFGVILAFRGPKGHFFWPGSFSKTVLVSTLLISVLPPIVVFSFFFAPMDYFWESGSKTVLGSIHVAEQLLPSMCPSILTFDFDLILG